MENQKFNISILLPTRGRTLSLDESVHSVFEKATDPKKVELILGFDEDDETGLNHWTNFLQKWLDRLGYPYRCYKFKPMGYTSLHHYNNLMASYAQGSWLMIWNDDAIMETQGWDDVIMKYNDQFRLLAFHTHNDHPYSIFPVVPHKWYELLGYISPHPTQDGWVSQQAYMLDIMERIDVTVTHDRYDLTGNNFDTTFRTRKMLEGNPEDPNDFHSVGMINLRHRDSQKLADHLRNQGHDMTFWDNIWKGKQDPWEKLAKNDTNKQMVQFANPHNHFYGDNTTTSST